MSRLTRKMSCKIKKRIECHLKEIAGNSLGMFLGFLRYRRYGKKSCNQLVVPVALC